MNNKSIYQDLKFFDKNGYEIPLVIASNIVIKIYNKYGSEKNATIMNGVYNNKRDVNGNFIIDEVKIIDVGRSFSFENVILENTIINVYVDGVLLKNTTIKKFNVLETSSFNIAYTSSNADLKEYKKYGIKDIDIEFVISKKELDTIFATDYDMPFPSLIFNADINMEKVSTGLHSVETLYFGIEKNGNLVKPYDSQYNIEFITDIKDDNVQFFTVDTNTDEIYKRHKISVDLADENTFDDDYFDMTSEEFDNVVNVEELLTKTPQINICFSSEEEGVHEQKIYIMLVDRNNEDNAIKIGEFNVIAETEGEDERFRAMFANFGIPDPIMYPSLFKECDIKEEKTNWEIVNRKSKELFLTYDEIFPYVGTYKALINAVKYLGYNDVYFREWYKDIKKGINYSKRININENFNDSRPFITYDNILENRMNQKKLNKLSLIYKLNEETNETDEYNIPILRNVYNYSVSEVYLKLKSLKDWLEKNIIALNCRIVEITGEGIVYEKTSFKTYGTIMQNLEHKEILSYEPYVLNKVEKIKDGSANIKVSIMNDSSNSYLTFEDFDETFGQYETTSNGTIKYPFIHSFHVKALLESDNAIVKNNFKEGALFINDNEILLLRDDKGNLINAKFDKAPIIHLQNATIREYSDVKNKTYKQWWNKIAFNVYNKSNDVYSYYIRNAKNEKYRFSNDYIMLLPIENEASFEYTYKADIDSPIFIFKGYKLCLYNDKVYTFDDKFLDKTQKYILEINKGKIINDKSSNMTSYITFNYDNESNEQLVKMSYQYENINYIDKKNKKDSSIAIYDNYYTINVNKSGKYNIMTYALNEYGNIFAKEVKGGCEVLLDESQLYSYVDSSYINNDSSFYYENSIAETSKQISNNEIPTLKWQPHIYDIELNVKNNTIKYPNLSYSYDTAHNGDYLNFTNINDRFIYHSNIDKRNYTFYSINKVRNAMNIEDTIQFIIYSKKVLNGIYEYSGTITNIYKNGFYDICFDEEIDIKDYLDNNYEFYIFPNMEYRVAKVEMQEDSNITNIFVEELIEQNAYIEQEDGNFEKAYYDDKDTIKPVVLNYESKISTEHLFNVGDVVKLLYQIGGDEKLYGNIYYTTDNENYYPVMYKYNNDFFPVAINDKGETEIFGETIEKTNIFCGGASFRIKDIDYKTGRITLDGIFNYKQYKDEYLYYKNNEELIPLRYISDNIYVQSEAGDYEYVKLTKHAAMTKITTNLFIAKANQLYVNYVLNAKDSVENQNTDTEVKVEKSRLYDFIDESYSLVITDFDKVNAFENWAYNVDKELFEHNKPLTIEKNQDIVYKLYSDNYSISFVRWNVYKQILTNKTRKLLFQVENDTLALNMKESGIYDIEVYVFDEYGNMTHKDYQAILNVK